MKNHIFMTLLCALVGGASVQATGGDQNVELHYDLLKTALSNVTNKPSSRHCDALDTLITREAADRRSVEPKTPEQRRSIEGLFKSIDNEITCQYNNDANDLCDKWVKRDRRLTSDLKIIREQVRDRSGNACKARSLHHPSLAQALDNAMNGRGPGIAFFGTKCIALDTLITRKDENGKSLDLKNPKYKKDNKDNKDDLDKFLKIEKFFKEMDGNIDCFHTDDNLCQQWIDKDENLRKDLLTIRTEAIDTCGSKNTTVAWKE